LITQASAPSAKPEADESGTCKTDEKSNSHDEGGDVPIKARLRAIVRTYPNEGQEFRRITPGVFAALA
jgi:hypothetical protein